MWTCQRCQYENDKDETQFCGRCGTARFAGDSPTPSTSRRKPTLPPTGGYFAFRKMISPALIRFLNVLGLLVFTSAGGFYLYKSYQESFANFGTLSAGVLLLFGGNLIWRMLCEVLILFFSMHEVLVSIESRLGVRE